MVQAKRTVATACPSCGLPVRPQNHFYGLLIPVRVTEADRLWITTQDLIFALNGFPRISTCHHLMWDGGSCGQSTWKARTARGERGHDWFPARRTSTPAVKSDTASPNGKVRSKWRGTKKRFNPRGRFNANPHCAKEMPVFIDVLLGNSATDRSGLVLTTNVSTRFRLLWIRSVL